ncbi:DUF2637 domain-containing protein [Streptomyces sp. NBC_00028]|uniref:DUF2637 domain-containing protein n=1 Tax=Streptomyces sp. NBC_00028 TaxID=2975624 RepID=UPI0032464F89
MNWHDRDRPYVPQYPYNSDPQTWDQHGINRIPAQEAWDRTGPDGTLGGHDIEQELAEMLASVSAPSTTDEPAAPHLSRSARRRMRPRRQFLVAGHRITQVTILFAAIAVCAACLLAWSITYTYSQLRTVAELILPERLAQWWPLTVYGPWLVAALSILRAAVQHQPARRSWGVLLVTSAIAVALCVSHSAHSVLAFVTLGIPPITALVCFWELIGQVPSKHRSRKGTHAQKRPRG